MRRIVYSASNKPSIAKSADKLVCEFDNFFQLLEYQENVEDVLSENEIEILQDAYDILMFADKSFTENYRSTSDYNL